ncbi:uncharacterized protein LOC120624977 isoform X2 [Pararge aegeria]|uniref:uncharacterized protein LOC120624977 isoform X2 n=1 Tax=Pararge aegeria TaxID=116150 RepID=UPI0019D2C2B1|nr:uncharacterized protein LOC120624977 isoform X2 [Pararge aegeria]
MRVFIYWLAMLLILHTCNSYILLSANMEDVRALAQQLAASPVVDQVKKIWRRASTQFKRELNRNSRRRGMETAGEGKDVSGICSYINGNGMA